MSILIREANLSDATGIISLLKQLKLPQEYQIVKNAIEKYTTDENYKFFVAEQNSKIVGIITLYISYLYLIPFKKCYIETLIIDQDSQKQGIGRELLQHSEKYALNQGCELIELISADWRKSQGVHDFYTKQGYINQGPEAISYFYKAFKKVIPH